MQPNTSSHTFIARLVAALLILALAGASLASWQYQDSLPKLDRPIDLVDQPAGEEAVFQVGDETAEKIERRVSRTRSRFFGVDATELAGELQAGPVPGAAIPGERLTWMSTSGEVWDKDLQFATGTADDPLRRERLFWEARAYPAGEIPADIHAAAIQEELQGSSSRAPQTPQDTPVWAALGPNPLLNITYAGQSEQNASGRAIAVAAHPTNPNVLLLGAAQGGLWRSTNSGANWTAVAENMPSLAIKVVRFSPSNPNVVYAGTGEPHSSTSIYGQGVLKSTDGGQTWTHLPASGSGWNFRYASISGLQVHPTNPNTVYITTAAIRTSVYTFNPAAAPQTGIYKSTDGGQSWTLIKAATLYPSPLTNQQGNVGFMDLELAQSNPNRMYASEYFGGVWRSDNGGDTWSRVTPLKTGGGPDLPAPVASFGYFAFDPRTGQQVADFFILNRFGLRDDLPEFTRIELGLAQSNPDVLYAGVSTFLLLDANGNGTFDNVDIVEYAGLVFKSTNGGNTWSWLGDWPRNGVPNYCATQCDYDNTVEVNPANANDLVLGGSANYNPIWPDPIGSSTRYLQLPWRGMVHRSLDGGSTFIDIVPHCVGLSSSPAGTFAGKPLYTCSPNEASRVIHPDIHAIAYNPHNGAQLYVASDGGLHRATTSGGGTSASQYTWANLNNNLATLQFYNFDVHPSNPNLLLGGLQDNSNAYWNGSSWEGWGFGDGTFGAFDPNNPNYVYMGTQFNIHRHDSGGAKRALDANGQAANGWNLSIFQPESGDAAAFLTPFEIDPVSSNIVYAGSSTGLYRSTNRGDLWSGRLNTDAFQGEPTTISVSPANHNLVYVGTKAGEVFLFNFSNSNFGLVSGGLPPRYISQVLASPNAANTVYVAVNGYNANTPATPGKIFKSTNQGSNWTNISGNLPDVPISTIAVDPNDEQRMWAGSDVGVFMTTNGGGTWTSYRGNMPIVAIMDMKYNAATGYLTVVTHGRGAWRVNPVASSGSFFLRLPVMLRNVMGPIPYPTATATSAPTNTQPGPTATATHTATPPGPTATATNPAPTLPALQNANFEQGNNGWTEFSTNFGTVITNQGLPAAPRSGSWLAWEGGANSEISSIYQTVSVPNGVSTFYLGFYFQILSDETFCDNTFSTDSFRIYLNSVFRGGFILCGSNNTGDWQLGYLPDDLSAYAGGNLTIELYTQTDASLVSTFLIDDVHFLTILPSRAVELQAVPAGLSAEPGSPPGEKPPGVNTPRYARPETEN